MLTERISLCLRPRLLAELRQIADARELSLSSVVRDLLRQKLAAERLATAEKETA